MPRTVILLLLTATIAFGEADFAPLEAFLRKQKAVRSLQADFTQERRLPSLKNPVTTKGRLWFQHPGRLRWELGGGPDTIAVSDGTTLTIAEANEKKARRLSVNDSRASQFSMIAGDSLRDLDAFRRTFELHESRMTSGIYQATLRPLDRRMRSNVPWMFLDIDPRTHHLRAIELQLKDGSRIRSIFTTRRINPSIPASKFQIDLTGYKVR